MVSVDVPALPEAVASSGGIPLLDPITLAFGFVLTTILIFGIWYLWENSGMRLLYYNNNRMRQRRFGEENIVEHNIIFSHKKQPKEVYEIRTQPIQVITKFGSIVPGYVADSRFPFTLDIAVPEAIHKYPTPEELAEGVNDKIERNLQTYYEKGSKDSMLAGLGIGGVLGIIAGFVLAGFGG
jgi:hypothetical protein